MPSLPVPTHLARIRLLAMDVDGVLTDGGITWATTAGGELLEAKTFSSRDGLGLRLVRYAGIETAWITGRISAVVTQRARELRVSELCQECHDKRAALELLTARLGLCRGEVLYLGDDLNDLPAFAAAGVTVTVADAPYGMRERADWVTEAAGGRGAVREVVDHLLRVQGRWDAAMQAFLAELSAR